jgi:ComF family protein
LDCLQNPPAFQRTQAFADYEGALQHMILAYKFHHQLKFAPLLADMLSVLLRQTTGQSLVIPIPQMFETTQIRGFIPLWHILKQTDSNTHFAPDVLMRMHHKHLQVSASAEQRHRQIKGAFAVTRDLTNTHIILIDDVYTTGATLNEAAKTCLEAGAKNVECLVLARGKWVK